MYTDKKNILQLVALLKEHSISKIVLCPGSRNSPIVHTLANHPFFTCYSVTDERSAGFFAMGLALHGGKPAAVCCTSGTALLNIHPAVAEAYYQHVPLIVISADRPGAWIAKWTDRLYHNRAYSVPWLRNRSICRKFIRMKMNGIATVLSTKHCWN